MAINHRARAWINRWLLYGTPLMVTVFLVLAIVVIAGEAKADTWTGAGQAVANQTRDWRIPANWLLGAVPPANASNTFTYLGEGTIELNGTQSASNMAFNNFTYSNIAPGLNPNPPFLCNLTMVLPVGGFGAGITMGEGVRDTYGVDYFTAGPQFSADVILGCPLGIGLGAGPNSTGSAMMFSGQILNPLINQFFYAGIGTGTSLWISSNNNFNGNALNPITVNAGGGGVGANGYTLHLVDAGRMDGTLLNPTPIVLLSTSSYLGLQDNRNGGPIPPLASNIYLNSVNSYGGNVYADRSYQINPLDTTINVEQYVAGGVRVYQGVANFGSTGPFGRTNNGFGLHLATLNWDTAPDSVTINVNNGNLTEGRGGSRYVSGANRLQEPNNYTYVSNLSENSSKLVPFIKGGNGVLVIDQVNGVGQWWTSPQVNAGVLRLGYPTTPQNAPSVILNTANSGVGIGWDTQIDQSGSWGPIAPFPINPITPGLPIGQSGAVDIDLWNFGWTVFANPTIDANVNNPVGQPTYLRVASSMGDDASFDPQPLAAIHASIAVQNQVGQWTKIVPYFIAPNNCYIHYLGGGGGTLRIDTLLDNYAQRNTMLEMGTTGTLLPGRVALNPGGDLFAGSNTYTGWTDICAGTLQLMKQNAVWGSALVSVWTYDMNITNGLYAIPSQYHNWWEGLGGYTWTGPGQLLLDPGRNGAVKDWSLGWYTANGGQPLYIIGGPFNNLFLDGGVIGWTGDVNLPGVPGIYGRPLFSNLANPLGQNVNVLGLGGEYSAGTMTPIFGIIDNITPNGVIPVLLYKAGMNSKLDLRQCNPLPNTYTGGTIIAGGEIIVSNSAQLNAHAGNINGGPIAILNGGRLHVTANTGFSNPIMVNTDGTPDLVKNCGSVIEVDAGVIATLNARFDFSWAPATYLEKDGLGTLTYVPQAPPAAGPNQNPANAWGLKLTAGLFQINQLPVNPGTDSGPVIFNNGNLEVIATPAGINNVDKDPAYGFRNIVSFQGTTSTVTVDDNTMFRTHGIVPNEILGTVNFVGSGDGLPANNIVDLSRNMASLVNPVTPGDYSRGNGTMTFTGVTVYMSGGGRIPAAAPVGPLNVLPQEAGFILQLNDGVVFNASHQNNVCGEVNFNNLNPINPINWVRIDGEQANPATPLAGPPYGFGLAADTWTIYGTGYTTWSGTTEKIGGGRVAIKRSTGAPVAINANTLLKISGGTFEAGGTADPFTDNTLNPGLSLDILNNSNAPGLLISQGVKNVDDVSGVGDTTVSGPAGTELIVDSIAQNNLTLGAGCTLTIRPIPGGPQAGEILTPVPEPATWLLLVIAAAGLLGWYARIRVYKSGG